MGHQRITPSENYLRFANDVGTEGKYKDTLKHIETLFLNKSFFSLLCVFKVPIFFKTCLEFLKFSDLWGFRCFPV